MSLARIVLGSLLLATSMIPIACSGVSAEGSPVELKASAANHGRFGVLEPFAERLRASFPRGRRALRRPC